MSKKFWEHEATLENRRLAEHSPNDETGKGGAKEGVGEDGAQVPEEVSLQVRQTNTEFRLSLGDGGIIWRFIFEIFACPSREAWETASRPITTGCEKTRQLLL